MKMKMKMKMKIKIKNICYSYNMSNFVEQLKRLHVVKNAFENQQKRSRSMDIPEPNRLEAFLEAEKNNTHSEFGTSALEIHNNIVALYNELDWSANPKEEWTFLTIENI